MLVDWRHTGDPAEVAKLGLWSNWPRKVVCDWVVAHKSSWSKWIPEGYPKQVKNIDGAGAVGTACIALGVLGAIISAVCLVAIQKNKMKQSIRYSQPNVLSVSVVGTLLVFITTIVFGVAPDDTICAARPIFLHLGYSLMFMPMLMRTYKVASILNNKKPVWGGPLRTVRSVDRRHFCLVGSPPRACCHLLT